MTLTEAELAAIARRAGEAHKATRMVSDETIQLIADEVGLIVDSDDLGPLDTGYTTTYDLNAVASEVWREKASMTAEGFDFAVEGGSFTRSQHYSHCLEMARKYGALISNLSA